MASHTPGPWRIDAVAPRSIETADERFAIATADDKGRAAYCGDDPSRFVSGEAAEANARLIAAAPDMLNALKSAHSVLLCADDEKIPRLQERINLVEAAIAKAEGRS